MAKTKKRPATKRPTRAQIAAREAKRKRDQRRRLVATALIVAVVAGLVVLGVATSRPGKTKAAPALSSAADPSVICSPDQHFDAITSGNGHTTGKVTYTVDPPAGGDHYPTAAAPGIYAEGKSPGDTKIVHALEHGYVAIWYNPDSRAVDLAKLENVWKHHKQDVILVERRSMPSAIPVVATAWHQRLQCSGTDDFQLNAFVEQYVNQGPEKPPHNVKPQGRKPRT